jgi:hypothetical protein
MTHAAHHASPLAQSQPAQALDALLNDLLNVHRALLIAAEDHRSALRAADGTRVQAAAERAATLHQLNTLLDQRRRELVAAHPIPGQPPEKVRLSDLAMLVEQPDRDRLLGLAEETKAVMSRVNDEHRTIRVATDVLLAHLEGLMRQVGQTLSHARTYTRKGFVEAGSPVVSALDLAC